MKISELLLAIAAWLEDSENQALVLAEENEKCLEIVASSLVTASDHLKKAADKIEEIECQEEEQDCNLTEDSIEELANIAEAFDKSGDPVLKKQASLLDELLVTIAADPSILDKQKLSNIRKIEKYKQAFNNAKAKIAQVRQEHRQEKAIEQKIKDIKDSKIFEKEDNSAAHEALSSRHCPDHPGCSLIRVSDDKFQCSLDKKIYDFREGYTKLDGTKIPAVLLELQPNMQKVHYTNFS